MKIIWQKIENWLEHNAPQIKNSLLPGASDSEIKSLEYKIGMKLPQDMIEFYKIHNGQKPDTEKLMDGEELLNLERIFEEWIIWKDLLNKGHFKLFTKIPFSNDFPAGIKNYWWNPKWIPVTYDGTGNHYSLDLDPSPEGIYGQIIRIWHDDSNRELISPSFLQWMNEFATALEKEKFIYSQEYGGVINKEFL